MNIISIIILLCILVITFIFLIRSKIIFLMSAGLQVGFFALLFLTLSTLFLPQIYTFLSDFALTQSGTREKIEEIDEKFIVNDIAETSEDVWNDIESIFTGEQQEEETDDTEGLFEEHVYPGLVSLVAFILRTIILILSLVGLIAIVYLSYATMGATDIAQLQHNYEQLQKRVEMLEQRTS